MTSLVREPISVAKAKHFVAPLENEKNQALADLLEQATLIISIELFAIVGKLTRQLHNSLNHFQLDLRLNEKVHSGLEKRLNGKPIKNEIFKDSANQTDNQKAEGPIIDAYICDYMVSGQDNVDDLLSSLGF